MRTFEHSSRTINCHGRPQSNGSDALYKAIGLHSIRLYINTIDPLFLANLGLGSAFASFCCL